MDDNYAALTIESEGKKAEQDLMAALSQSSLLSSCYAYKSRVKPEAKLVEKKVRKIDKKPGYDLSSITDVIGLRFVTLFKKDISDIFDHLISIILHEDSLNPNPFCKGVIEEVIVYHTNPHDPLAANIEEIMSEKGINPSKTFECVHSLEGYSSIHVVSRINHKVGLMGPDYFIPIEIQIRTVFEDAWGEIDHKYGYVIREGKSSGDPVQNLGSVLSHLVVLKKFSDACAEYADVIHTEATSSKLLPSINGKVISVLSDEILIGKFKQLGVSDENIAIYEDARAVRAKGEDLIEADYTQGAKVLLVGAEKFMELSSTIWRGEIDKKDTAKYLFYYYLKMNEAVCLMATNKGANILLALQIYGKLELDYPNFPLLQMRMGQALGKRRQKDKTLDKYERVHAAIKEFEDNGQEWSDAIPEIDYHHIKGKLPMLYGYALWAKANSINDKQSEEKLDLLKKAYDITQGLLELEESPERSPSSSIYNNLLYYAVEIASFDKDPDPKMQLVRNEIPDLINKFIECVDINDCENIMHLDTITKAYDFIGEQELAIPILRRIVKLASNRDGNTGFDRESILDIAEEAISLLQKSLEF